MDRERSLLDQNTTIATEKNRPELTEDRAIFQLEAGVVNLKLLQEAFISITSKCDETATFEKMLWTAIRGALSYPSAVFTTYFGLIFPKNALPPSDSNTRKKRLVLGVL